MSKLYCRYVDQVKSGKQEGKDFIQMCAIFFLLYLFNHPNTNQLID